MANKHLMPRATATWLIENTCLTFAQIADFYELHILEIQAIADDTLNTIKPKNPILLGILTKKEINRCEKDPTQKLHISDSYITAFKILLKKQDKPYVPKARRNDKPDAILWLLKNYPNIKNSDIIKIIGTTASTIKKIQTKNHWNYTNLVPRDPVILGICTQTMLKDLLETTEKRL